METNIVTPQSDSGSVGLIAGLVMAAVIVTAAIYFGLPYFSNNQMRQSQQPQSNTINLAVPVPDVPSSPTIPPAPAPDSVPRP